MGSPGHSSSSMDPWALRSANLPADSWLAAASTRDADALTHALRASLSSHLFPLDSIATDPDVRPASRSGAAPLPGASGRVSKRKSRATKRVVTTFIAADPANFREMVQQVTGVGVAVGQVDVAPVEAQLGRSGGGGYTDQHHYLLLPTTLDTSAFFAEQQHQQLQVQEHHGLVGLDEFGGPAQELDGFQAQLQSFPTLESWKVM